MNDIILKFAAIAAILLGLLSVFTGTMVLSGSFNPGYVTHLQLITYNVILGLISLYTSFMILRKNKRALIFSAGILFLHSGVLILLVSVFHEVVAQQSINAMIFRVVVWLFIFIKVYTHFNNHKRKII